MGKLQAAVIFGGQSSEHIVSCMSAVNVIEHIDRTRYDVLLVGITEDGHWIKADSLEDVKNGTWRDKTVSALLLPDATKKCILLMEIDDVCASMLPDDVTYVGPEPHRSRYCG